MTQLQPPRSQELTIVVVGLGYVGLSLAAGFARTRRTIGFDVDASRVKELHGGDDRNEEFRGDGFGHPNLSFTTDANELSHGDIFIVTVPTPVDKAKRPDLSFLISASRTVGTALRERSKAKRGPAIVVYESTVYPGCTEEACLPVLESTSGLRRGVDFKLGYSPERVNPGDAAHSLESVVKVVAGEDQATSAALAGLYGSVVKAGIHVAPDIRTAEAAKVIENTQRDLNIALMNELSILFHRLGIDTREVLKAAGTKWNFLPFRPGLVGGHCIPEDPYYLTHKAEEVGYIPHVILAGRRINDSMGVYVGRETVKLLAKAGRPLSGARALVLGVTFKEDVSDTRNTRVLDLVRELESFGVEVDVQDPRVPAWRLKAMGLRPTSAWTAPPGASKGPYDAVVLAVPHRTFREADASSFLALFREGGKRVLVDIKGTLDAKALADTLYWTL